MAWRDRGRTNPRSETLLPPVTWLLRTTDTARLFSTAGGNEGDREPSGLPLRPGHRRSAPENPELSGRRRTGVGQATEGQGGSPRRAAGVSRERAPPEPRPGGSRPLASRESPLRPRQWREGGPERDDRQRAPPAPPPRRPFLSAPSVLPTSRLSLDASRNRSTPSVKRFTQRDAGGSGSEPRAPWGLGGRLISQPQVPNSSHRGAGRLCPYSPPSPRFPLSWVKSPPAGTGAGPHRVVAPRPPVLPGPQTHHASRSDLPETEGRKSWNRGRSLRGLGPRPCPGP